MFTGLIREIGRLKSKSPAGGVVRLRIEAPELAGSLGVGDSVAVNGICLTVTSLRGRNFLVEAATETMRLTTLSNWRSGDSLHLEPALRAGDPLDGHIVQGHVDGVGEISRLRQTGRDLLMTVALPVDLAANLTPKGSVSVDGVSLTVDEGPFDGEFTVNLIPHTLAATTFGKVRRGRKVNLEMDVLVKAARSGASSGSNEATKISNGSGINKEYLLARGFGRLGSRSPRRKK
jgi:riboflavin synthase